MKKRLGQLFECIFNFGHHYFMLGPLWTGIFHAGTNAKVGRHTKSDGRIGRVDPSTNVSRFSQTCFGGNGDRLPDRVVCDDTVARKLCVSRGNGLGRLCLRRRYGHRGGSVNDQLPFIPGGNQQPGEFIKGE